MNKEEIITYDLKIVTKSNKYIFLNDDIETLSRAEIIAKNFIDNNERKEAKYIQIWKTKNNLSAEAIGRGIRFEATIGGAGD